MVNVQNNQPTEATGNGITVGLFHLADKRRVAVTEGTLRTDTLLFAGLLVGVILLVGALSFFPALALGPIAEHLQGI